MTNQKNLLVITAKDNRGEILRYEDGKIMTKGLTSEDVEKFALLDRKVEERVRVLEARELTSCRQQEPGLEL